MLSKMTTRYEKLCSQFNNLKIIYFLHCFLLSPLTPTNNAADNFKQSKIKIKINGKMTTEIIGTNCILIVTD